MCICVHDAGGISLHNVFLDSMPENTHDVLLTPAPPKAISLGKDAGIGKMPRT